MKFIKHLSLYTFISFFSAGINFFLMPYLSHFLTPGDYGIISMINSFVTILIPIVGLVASGLIFVEYYKITDKREFASLFSSLQVIPLVLTFVLLLMSLPFQNHIARFLEIPENKSYWVPLSFILALLSIYIETLFTYNVIQKHVRSFAIFNILRLAIELGLTIWFVSVLNMGWEGRLFSWLLTTIVFFLISLKFFDSQRLLVKNIKFSYILSGVAFGLPLILHTVGKFIINQSDRVFIAKMISIQDSGIYNVGYQVGMLMLLLVNAITNFYQPFLYERLSDLNMRSKIEIVRMSYLILLLLVLALLCLTFIAPLFFTYLVDKNYLSAIPFVFWVAFGYLFWGVYILFAGNIFYYNKTKILGYAAMFNVGLNIILNYMLINIYGALGAAYATCISFFVVAMIVIFFSNKLVSLPWLNFGLILKRNEKAF